jgi:hypothetical protein
MPVEYCTQEMDDLSEKAVKHVIEYCLEILEEVDRLEAALDLQYAEQYENKVFQYRWALRHPVVGSVIQCARSSTQAYFYFTSLTKPPSLGFGSLD